MITAKTAKETSNGNINWYFFENKNGMKMTVTNYGATLTSVIVPDRQGNMANVVLGYNDIESYLAGTPFFGSTAGRFANRIGGAKFEMNGKIYELTANKPPNHLHGGKQGFDKKIWKAEINGNQLELRYTSPDGEEGYPAELKTKIVFKLTEDNAVDISYEAESDGDTIVNLTNHSYFNLNGGKEDVLEHIVTLDADNFTSTDDMLIPTGDALSVENTPMDFRTPHKLGERINQKDYDAIAKSGGYDNNYLANGKGMRSIATLYEESTGRHMEVETDQIAVQLYSGQNMKPGTKSREGGLYGPFYGVCFETQVCPDTPNKPQLGSAQLKKGEKYTHHTRYIFSTK